MANSDKHSSLLHDVITYNVKVLLEKALNFLRNFLIVALGALPSKNVFSVEINMGPRFGAE